MRSDCECENGAAVAAGLTTWSLLCLSYCKRVREYNLRRVIPRAIKTPFQN